MVTLRGNTQAFDEAFSESYPPLPPPPSTFNQNENLPLVSN